MSTWLQFVITLLLSGVIAAIVSAIMQKRNEKESRLFNAKLEAYKEFAEHLQSRFTSLVKNGKDLDIATLAEVSSKCLLVSNSAVNKELKALLVYTHELYKKCSSNEESDSDFEKLRSDADRVENLMREDLGFK